MLTSAYGRYLLVPNSSGGQSRVCPEMERAIKVAFWLAGLTDKLVYTQGGLNDSAVAASAKTHDGLCVADLRITNMTDAEIWRAATWLLRCGVIANIRGVVDSLTDHFHCVMANPVHAHDDAKGQVAEYRRGGDGLIGEKPFYGPKVPFTTWEDSPYHGLDDFTMATPADVWKADVVPGTGEQSAGEILWDLYTRVKGLWNADVAVGDQVQGAAKTLWAVFTQTRATGEAVSKLAAEVAASRTEVAALRTEVAALKPPTPPAPAVRR